MPSFGDLERSAAELYPYRWPITAGLLLAAAGIVAFAARRRWHAVLWRHRLATLLVAAPVLTLALPVGWYALSPLWTRSHLEEASPLAIRADSQATDGSTTAAAPASTFLARTTHMGAFMGADGFHFGRGRALIIETEPGRYTLRVEEFSVRNGPDLYVYLTPAPDGGSVEGAINLGKLKATDGSFNYEIPPGTDIARFKNAIVWCRRFSALFASAPLEPA